MTTSSIIIDVVIIVLRLHKRLSWNTQIQYVTIHRPLAAGESPISSCRRTVTYFLTSLCTHTHTHTHTHTYTPRYVWS